MYDIFYISNNTSIEKKAFEEFKLKYPFAKHATSYEEAKSKSFTKLFWLVWSDLVVNTDFNFKFDIPTWDYKYIHVFKNGDFFDGICLSSKEVKVSEREFKHRFFINKKEIDIQLSNPKQYDIFYIESYNDYLKALEDSSTDLFWIIPNEVVPLPDFKFDLYFSHHNSYERKLNHVFKNKDIIEDKYNGIMLLSKYTPISKRELDFRFLIEKKEYDIVASQLKLYDIIFISYNEPNAEENFNNLKTRFPKTKRVNGVKGIHQAHIAAAQLSSTPMFWVVDGDAVVSDNFDFSLLLPHYDRDIVHVWQSQNPINNLVYGYGGVKLLPKQLSINMDVTSADMTTSISSKFRAMPSVSNITAFNTDEFSAWRSAFRECVKLSSRAISGQDDSETQHRLDIWCSIGADKLHGKISIDGALAGRKYGQENAGNQPALSLINDFDWLKRQFQQTH
jgi:hypothetical protein